MILEYLITVLVDILLPIIDFSSFVIPEELVEALCTVTCYGSWIVGSDLLLIFAGCIFAWHSWRLSSSIFIFVWKMLPFT